MSSVFLSDLHLEDSESRTFEGLRRILEDSVTRNDDIYILGDLVEVWVGDDDDSDFAWKIKTLLRSIADQVEVRLMHGNRDFLFGRRFSEETNVQLIEDPFCTEIDGLTVLLSHGDVLCTGDTAYQQMRKLFRSSEWQTDILSQSLKDRRMLANSLREQSRKANANKAQNIMDVDQQATLDLVNMHDADVFIHGHTHRPAKHRIDKSRYRIVLGDWWEVGWAARINEGEVSLQCFSL